VYVQSFPHEHPVTLRSLLLLASAHADQSECADVTGPDDATKAIVVVYDIFGYFDQTIQGADILAYSDHHQKYKIYMPDWFEGKPCPIEM
jgi:hypothetical protein